MTVADVPTGSLLVDGLGRRARDLRISLTQACNLRCRYCMPAEGLPIMPRDELLSTAEVARLVDVAVHDLGIEEVRLTGGEPLIRRDLEEIVAAIRARHPELPVALTTNGLGLTRRAAALAAAGLSRINISLDTVDRELFAQITRRDRLPEVLDGIDAAVAAGLSPVKINAVALHETLPHAPQLLRWCLDRGLSLRFIESMPLDADGTWSRDGFVTAAQMLEVLGGHFALEAVGREDPGAPAELWRVDGGPGTVGVIASMSRSFCGACDRTRITAEGRVRPCLFSDDEIDLRAILRGGGDDAALAAAWREVTWRKSPGHLPADVLTHPRRSMGAIGG
ncbi:molybdenum cofactor biosynthesis protein MoaA [Gordonia hirsuta DSM 44140 = NBRC 16056]|uniref:GTP 3',8-cyclase n=1 Tax=Gordonia hirsuta DSM 44140 = NBRC 16056 TaxID=1121927 RepID=L7L8W9_9ACTN|nr:GTP 3',8-cyclase MoaA [Gordonia hirsuta]GAC57590.1 molybdenum cofactor biosynthesis protein MoaA [Gordonia hirsuta DSM 44140 = NBRC 16056]